MAEETKNTNLISKKNSGFPDYLDFEKLRSEGIDYLGRLSGKIWTDHNVHDPGITILEMLCYALIDLGYRTNLPEQDIFTRDPGDSSADNNFFTPSKILACNPLTIIDFRKLLIDIEGVKNAWLEVATDEKDFCRPAPQTDPAGTITSNNNNNTVECKEFLNGLYHVYIDLEKNVDKEFDNEADKKKYVDDIIQKVREALMAHRNLCEDFVDIYILCKQETGVCADIELEDNADAEKVYITMVEKLRQFFSPSPQFYTLQQLLDKGKPIDEIFAGRPYNITESHGFVDTEELEQLKLRKEIHLSDVYNILFGIEGVSAVRDLRLQFCKTNQKLPSSNWKFHIPENHVPDFSLPCSGFQFTRNGIPVLIDFEKFEGLFEINFSHNGKILYKQPSPYLDGIIPIGTYRGDLADYYSIQNEFPRVYGIAEGGLSDNASPLRKAQAYQLKGYLLFFDQLLANYLAQLKNIRSLFAMSSQPKGESHTYFINQLTTVPDHQKLIRFNVNENNSNALGAEGSILVVPVDKEKLLKLKELDELKNVRLKDHCALDVNKDRDPCLKNVVYIDQYHFATLAEQDTAINQVKNDLYYDQAECEFVTRTNECVYYYILTSSDKIALISKQDFKNTEEAKQHAMSVKYIAGFDENYRSFVTSTNDFSFDLELNLLSFAKYLQLLVEDKELFYQRRQGFLNHLLSRFAEQFTDYVMLSFGLYTSEKLQALDIKNKERFLTHYDELSSNRGRAYDYLLNNWNNDNVSGFEKKFKAISGIENWKRHSLCNFVVDQYENQYAVSLRIAGTRYFTADEKYDTREEALSAAEELFKALKDKSNYQAEYVKHENAYVLKINYAARRQAVFPAQFAAKQDALSVADNITGLFSEKDPAGNVFVSSFRYTPDLKDATGRPIRRSVDSYSSNDEAKANALKSIKRISDPGKWEVLEKDVNPGHLYQDTKRTDVLSFINTDAFKIDIDDTIIGKPDKFTYSVLDRENNFKFNSVKEFDDSKLARANAEELLVLLTDEANYAPARDHASGKSIIRITDGKDIQAVSSHQFEGEREILDFQKRIFDIVKKQQYFITVDEQPHRWKFNYQLGFERYNLHSFESITEFAKPEEAAEAAKEFYRSVSALELKETENAVLLAPPPNAKTSAVKFLVPGEPNPETGRKAIKSLLDEQKEIKRFLANPGPEAFSSSVAIDEISQQGLYVYRLVDKDNIPAFYTKAFADKAGADPTIKQLSKYFKNTPIYLKLCAGGDIIGERKDTVTNQKWYHYQLKAINRIYTSGDLAGKSLVLFESTKGYASKEEAEKAFQENYLMLIYLASDALNYGPGKKISLTEVLVHNADPCIKNDSIVFIPAATLKELAPTPGDAVKEMVKLALSYPVRMVKFKSQKFYDLFPCEEKEDEDEPIDCKKNNEKEKWVYYFTLAGLPGETESWRSVKFYDDPAEARKDFAFFLILLRYAGNYFVDCDHCSPGNGYRIYIREVLAESAERFLTKGQAWGPDGVEKFICVSQSEDAFHAYQRKTDCCYSFFVACGIGMVYHPCKYDTAKKRDEAMLSLYKELKEFIQKNAYQVQDNGNTIILFNGKGESFAVIDVASRQARCLSDWITELKENLGNDKNYKEENGRIVLLNDKNEILARSDKAGFTIAAWKEMLHSFICYFPIVKIKDEKTGREQYCIEIKLPGFNTCKEDSAEEQPCMCGTEMPEDPHLCHIAWKGRCCFTTCNEAEQALQAIIKLLLNFNYYLPVFDCICDGYGIMLQFSKIDAIPDPRLTYYYHEANIPHWNSSQLIAINPQCYDSPEMACDAISRAKKLINSEGLHLVEHILLRPRCNPEDCQCPQYSQRCESKTDCHFEWNDPDEDPCTDDTPICFEPGADPYSFIATVVLPAWPQRFRKKENRALLENILYREAPAHVLLRILWLAPHDFCCFESKYKNWNRWLALKKTCIDDFSICDFLDFLFNRNYECLESCNVCGTCEDDQQPTHPCFVRVFNVQEQNKYLNQINDLYCWRVQYCGEYTFIDCEDQQTDFRIIDRGATIEVAETPEVIPAAPEEKPVGSRKETVINKPGEKVEREKEIVEPKKAEPGVSRSKRQVVNSRMTKYRADAEEVFAKSKQNPVAGKVQSFLMDPEPSIDRLSKLQSEIIQNKEPKSGKPLTKSQIHSLLQSMISYYLDKICFNGKDSKKIGELKKTMEKLKKEKVNPAMIFGYWNMEEVRKYEPELDTAEIKKLFVMADK